MNEKHDNTNADALPFTGERYVPEVQGVQDVTKLEHLHRYLFACKVVAGKCVLDIASGEGYGSSMLARTALKVTGVDVSDEAVSHAQAKYQTGNLEYLPGSCSKIPLADASVDVVVSFETIEHHDEHETMMREIKRVLRPGGLLVMSSPDRWEYSDKPGYSNPYHVKELYRHEFKDLLNLHFKNHSVYGQRVVYGSAIFCEDRSSPIESYDIADDNLLCIPGVPYPVYLVAVASDAEIPFLASGILEQPLNETDVVKGLAGIIAERDVQIADLNRQLTVRDMQIADLNRQLAVRDMQIADLSGQLAVRDKHIHALKRSFSWRITQPVRTVIDFVLGNK